MNDFSGSYPASNNKSRSKRQPGRPRDESLEDRVLDTAIILFAQSGWKGFTFESLARTARVGKAALYGRWESREHLLSETLEKRWLSLDAVDMGSFREDMTALAQTLFKFFSGPNSNVMLYLQADALQHEEVRRVRYPYALKLIQTGRAIVTRAKERGELSEDANAALIMDMLTGAISNHISTTPLRLKPVMIEKSDDYISSLVKAIEKACS